MRWRWRRWWSERSEDMDMVAKEKMNLR